jgi:ATP-binding cassette subfamily C protein CydD
MLAFVFASDWVSGLVLLAGAPLIPLFMLLIGGGAERLNQRQWRKLARQSAHFLDALQGLTTLKLFNASRREADRVARMSDDYRKSTMSVLRVAFLSALALEFFATAGVAVVAVLNGFRLLHAQMSFETGFFILLLAPEFYLPLRTFGVHYHARMDAIGAAERIVEILDHRPPEAGPGRARPPLTSPLDIRFDDLHYAYGPGREALRGASFDLAAGRITALVGPSGAGKSTVVNTLLGFVRAQRGCVLVGGHDLSQVDPDHWLAHVAWVPQRPHLFQGSVLDNIRMADETIAFERAQSAARRAHADEFIERLPGGYHAPVCERGANLSGGQVQRLALARAFLKDAPLLLMDEATAALDLQTERLVTDAIADLTRGRTVLVIAHRLRTVRHAERILVMDCGRIAEQGTHDELVRAEGRYAQMVRTGSPLLATEGY